MTTATPDVSSLEEATGIEELVPRCELTPLNPIATLMSLLQRLTSDDPECGNRARWQLHFKCGNEAHEAHMYLACDQHREVLDRSALKPGMSIRWEAL